MSTKKETVDLVTKDVKYLTLNKSFELTKKSGFDSKITKTLVQCNDWKNSSYVVKLLFVARSNWNNQLTANLISSEDCPLQEALIFSQKLSDKEAITSLKLRKDFG